MWPRRVLKWSIKHCPLFAWWLYLNLHQYYMYCISVFITSIEIKIWSIYKCYRSNLYTLYAGHMVFPQTIGLCGWVVICQTLYYIVNWGPKFEPSLWIILTIKIIESICQIWPRESGDPLTQVNDIINLVAGILKSGLLRQVIPWTGSTVCWFYVIETLTESRLW